MKFCLMINATTQWQESVQHALSLASSIYANGHEVNTVFFYGESVKVIQDSKQLQQWQTWQHKSQSNLQLCSTLTEQYQLDSLASQTSGFTVVSLASWVQAVEAADKMVELS